MSQNTSVPDSIGRGGLAARDLESIAGKPRNESRMWVVTAIIVVILIGTAVVMGISLFNLQDSMNQMNASISDINNKFQAISMQLTLAAMQPSPVPSITPTPDIISGTGEGSGQTPVVWVIKITPPESLFAGDEAVITIEVSQESKPAANSDVSLTFSGTSAPKLEEVVPQGPYKTDANGKLEITFPLMTVGDFTFTAKAGDKEESATFTVEASPDSDGDGVNDVNEQSALYGTDPNHNNSYIVTSSNKTVNFRLLDTPDIVAGGITTGTNVFGFESLQPTNAQTLAFREVELIALYKPGTEYSKDQPVTLRNSEELYDPMNAEQVILKMTTEQSCSEVVNSVKPFCEVIGSQGDFLVVKIRGNISDSVLKPVSEQVTPSPTPTGPVITPTETPEATLTPTP